MKTINKIIVIVLLSVSCAFVTSAQNLNSMPVAQRDSFLISLAKEAVLKFGPDYYREYKQPIVSYEQFPSADKINDKRFIKDADRYYYVVTFLYDPAEETLEFGYAAKVNIWADNGTLWGVSFGNGFGKGASADWRNDTTIEPMPYYAARISPDYDFNNPDPNQDPKNKELLIKEGYVRSTTSPWSWSKTTPDVPPHKRVKK